MSHPTSTPPKMKPNTNDPTNESSPSTETAPTATSSQLTLLQALTPPPLLPRKIQTPLSRAHSQLEAMLQKNQQQQQQANINPSPIWNLSWSMDGSILASAHGTPDPCIRLWKKTALPPLSSTENGRSGEEKEQDRIHWALYATLRMEDDPSTAQSSARTIRSVAFAPTPPNVRHMLAAAGFDGSIVLWEDFGESDDSNDEDDWKEDYSAEESLGPRGWECTAQLEGHESEVKDIAWNTTGTLLASCGRDKAVWIWECFLAGTIGADGTGSGASQNALDQYRSGGAGGEGDFECVAVLSEHTGDVKCVKFAPSHDQWGDGDDILLSASYDDTIIVWAEDAGEWYGAVKIGGVHSSTIWSLGLYPGGVRMVSASADASLAIWRCYTASEKREMQQQQKSGDAKMYMETTEASALAFSGHAQDGLWKCVGTLPKAHDSVIYSVDCAPAKASHGRIVSGGADNAIHIYREVLTDSSTSEAPVFCLDATQEMAHDSDVNCVAWHPYNGAVLASAGDDGLIKLWNYIL